MTPETRKEVPAVYRVWLSDVLFEQMGLDLVDWGQPDAQGFYTPIVHRTYADREVAEARATVIAEAIRRVEGLDAYDGRHTSSGDQLVATSYVTAILRDIAGDGAG